MIKNIPKGSFIINIDARVRRLRNDLQHTVLSHNGPKFYSIMRKYTDIQRWANQELISINYNHHK